MYVHDAKIYVCVRRMEWIKSYRNNRSSRDGLPNGFSLNIFE